MIEKVLSVCNVGRLVSYTQPSGDLAFRKLTLVFGENGQGKSMLCAIFRSLGDGDGKHIQERCTLGKSDQPEVLLRLTGRNAKFQGGTWDTTLPTIEVFDRNFVVENVYVGNTVLHENKKNLYQFSIGQENVKLVGEIATIDDAIRTNNTNIRELEATVSKYIIGNLPINRFIALENVDDIDQKIEAKKKEKAAVEKAVTILGKKSLTPVSLPKMPNVNRVLSKGLEDVLPDTETLVKKHIEECLDESGENWISKGLQYSTKEICPFCGQDIKSVELIEAYKAYFSAAYADLKKEIEEYRDFIESVFGHGKFASFEHDIELNKELSAFWEEYIDVELTDIPLADVKGAWDEAFKTLKSAIDNKSKAPLDTSRLTGQETREFTQYMSFYEIVETYNAGVRKTNARIEQKKNDVRGRRLDDVKAELLTLENIKARFSEEVDKLCTQHIRLTRAKRKLLEEKETKKSELDGLAAQILPAYEQNINKYLEKFNAGFRIVRMDKQHVGGKPSVDYLISINDTEVPLDKPSAGGNQPCFRNTLSCGDRSALALSFFLAKMDKDPDLQNKIVILDDPLSSLDSSRRACTRHEISRIADTANQTIVLSHDQFFLHDLWKSRAMPRNTLRIFWNGTTSQLSEWDIESETRGEYFKNYDELCDYRDNGPRGSSRSVAKCIRPILEGNLRIRYPTEFKGDVWLGGMLQKISEAGPPDLLFSAQTKLQDLEAINEYSKDFHHDQNPHADSHPIVDAELEGYVRRTVELVTGF